MDFVSKVSAITPVPILSVAWTAFSLIWDAIYNTKTSKQQLRTLAESIAHLLYIVNGEYAVGSLKEADTFELLGQLNE